MWELKQQAKLSGLGLGSSSDTPTQEDTSSESTKNIDATTDEGIMEMQARGLPVKFIPAVEVSHANTN